MASESTTLDEAILLHQNGKLKEAESAYLRILDLEPSNHDALHLLGLIKLNTGNLKEAIELIEKAISLRPHAAFYVNLGLAHAAHNSFSESEKAYKTAINLNDKIAEAHFNLGNLYAENSRLEPAIARYTAALELDDKYTKAHTNLGLLFLNSGQKKKAEEHLNKAHTLQPGDPANLLNLGNLKRELGQFDESYTCFENAIALKADFAEAHLGLGNICKDIGEVEKAIVEYQKAIALKPQLSEAESNLIYTELFLPSVTSQSVYDSHVKAAAKINSSQHVGAQKRPLTWPPKIGFVSGDFREHPVGHFTIKTIEWLAKNNIEIVLYANQLERDALTERFQNAATNFKIIYKSSDLDVCNLITDDAIDVLFDLTGHNGRNRLGVFAQKPAPIQITWAGYMATTGLKAMDYIIGDKWHTPEGSERFYSEKIIRLPHSFICFDAPENLPIAGDAPYKKSGAITFGCFNIPAKVNSEVVSVWAEILKQLPDAKLLLKARQFGSERAKARVVELFKESGINSSQIEFATGSGRMNHIKAFSNIDISLDPFPFSGSTTTLESLYMGVPVITLPGETFSSRHSSSYLETLGCSEFIAHDKNDYVGKVLELANDRQKITALRKSLRTTMLESPLCNIEKFGPDFLKSIQGLVSQPA